MIVREGAAEDLGGRVVEESEGGSVAGGTLGESEVLVGDNGGVAAGGGEGSGAVGIGEVEEKSKGGSRVGGVGETSVGISDRTGEKLEKWSGGWAGVSLGSKRIASVVLTDDLEVVEAEVVVGLLRSGSGGIGLNFKDYERVVIEERDRGEIEGKTVPLIVVEECKTGAEFCERGPVVRTVEEFHEVGIAVEIVFVFVVEREDEISVVGGVEGEQELAIGAGSLDVVPSDGVAVIWRVLGDAEVVGVVVAGLPGGGDTLVDDLERGRAEKIFFVGREVCAGADVREGGVLVEVPDGELVGRESQDAQESDDEGAHEMRAVVSGGGCSEGVESEGGKVREVRRGGD